MEKTFVTAIFVLIISLNSFAEEIVTVGWISDLSGNARKYGADKALEVALDKINKDSKYKKKLKVISEDGKCGAIDALKAAKKLIYLNKVDIILGGHCSPESAAIANFMEQTEKLMIASVSATPILKDYPNFVFRTSPTSLKYAPILFKEIKKIKPKRFAIVYEETDYTSHPATQLNELLKNEGVLTKVINFPPNTKDLRAYMLKVKQFNPDGIYVATQFQDTSREVFKFINLYDITTNKFGNEVSASAVKFFPNLKEVYRGLKYAEVHYDPNDKESKEFEERFYNFHHEDVPYGFWTADAYDGVMLLADIIQNCEVTPKALSKCLKNMKIFKGASGDIKFNSVGDAVREYVIKNLD